MRSEITNLKSQLSDAKNGGSVKITKSIEKSVLPIIQTANTPKVNQSSEKQAELKKKQLDMNIHFEKEAMHKKKILEIDKDNEKLAFDLFSKELKVRKLMKLEDVDQNEIKQYRSEINELKSKIEENSEHKKSIQNKLSKLEEKRSELLYNFRDEIDEEDNVDALYNQHLLNLQDIEYTRKEKQAEFHIKQREMYIDHLKKQLQLRDQIIKEKLGSSITNFLKTDLLTMQDIEGVSQEVLLPSLKMTKSKNFNVKNSYNTVSQDDGNYTDGNSYSKRKYKTK